jgi:hypothetical protein
MVALVFVLLSQAQGSSTLAVVGVALVQITLLVWVVVGVVVMAVQPQILAVQQGHQIQAVAVAVVETLQLQLLAVQEALAS